MIELWSKIVNQNFEPRKQNYKRTERNKFVNLDTRESIKTFENVQQLKKQKVKQSGKIAVKWN